MTASMRSAMSYIRCRPAACDSVRATRLITSLRGSAIGIDRMAEADHHFLGGDPAADVRLGLIRGRVTLLDFESGLVGAAVLGAAQGADGAGDAEYMSDPVPAITRAAKVEALNSCSA